MTTRPIAGSYNWMTTQASRLLTKILLPHVKEIPVRLNNTDDLIADLERFNRTPGYRSSTLRIGTADVTAMYPSIPLEEGLTALKWFSRLSFGKEESDFILVTAKWILSNNLVRFGDFVYDQVVGTAMGTNFAPLYADIVMWFHEMKCLRPIFFSTSEDEAEEDEYNDRLMSFELFETRYPTSMEAAQSVGKGLWIPEPKTFGRLDFLLYRRYLDDIFLILDETEASHEEDVASIKSITQHSALSLSAIEISNTTPFLDLEVRVSGDKLEWSLYKKPMVTNLFLPPFSQHAPAVAKSWVCAEFVRIMKRSSSPKIARSDILNFIVKLSARGFQWHSIKRALRNARRPRTEASPSDDIAFIPLTLNTSTMDLSIVGLIETISIRDKALASAAVGSTRFSPAFRTETNLERLLLPKHRVIAKFQNSASSRLADSPASATEGIISPFNPTSRKRRHRPFDG